MTTNRAILDRLGDKSVLRFERHLARPPERVWSLVTEPAELAHWFPATVSYAAEPGPGVGLRFRFEGQDTDTTGVILEYLPPKVFSFRWQDDVLRFELVPDGDGCQLHFSHVISDSMGGALAAGRNAAGWDTCLDTLVATLDAHPPQPPRDMYQRIEAYLEQFGLDQGEVIESDDGCLVRFQRDLVWQPLEQIWDLLCESDRPNAGGSPPIAFTNRYVEAGEITEVVPPHVLEYAWRYHGVPAGLVRWEFTADPKRGHRMVLTQSIPATLAELQAHVLATWHSRLRTVFAQLGRQPPSNGSPDRTGQLRETYQAGLP